MSTSKALPATTIIPDNLYVEREADRQLNGVIEEMGRPGYILVARQMGKTNLLLRMKRNRESQGDLVLYLDLSIHFETARDLFRTIIDKILETLAQEDLSARVERERMQREVDANAEYDRHLRLLLEATPHAKIVIVLDEIDSLVGHSYSDRILSQIRSMYFARANYPVYGKATYVLSGVAEPTDLIKDRNVSPFNIGEKIYLSDFTLSEVTLFTSKARLNFGSDIIESVYAWSCGNPRMTWDICAALEDLQRAGEKLSPSSVDAVIQKLYLTRFDRPPLDHIRALAEADQEVRDALVTLLYGKGNTLDDRARSKLYLAGITTASANEAPTIKNRVIEHAISEAWLAQVEAGKKGLLEAASKRYDEKDYEQAIALFNQFLHDEGALEDLTDIRLMELGLSNYNLSRLAEAERALSLALEKTRSSELRNLLRFHLATSKLLSGDAGAALPLLEDVAKAPGAFQIQALHQLGSALAATAPVENAERVIEITRSVISQVDADADISKEMVVELKAASHYNLAQIYRAINEKDEAKRHITAAVHPTFAEEIPGLAFLLLDEGLDQADRHLAFVAAAKAVISGQLPYGVSPGSFAFKRLDMAVLLALAAESGENGTFDALLKIATQNSGENSLRTLLDLADEASRPAQSEKLFKLVERAISDDSLFTAGAFEQRLEARRKWLTGVQGIRRDDAFPPYWQMLRNPEVDYEINEDDIILLLNRLGEMINSGRLVEAEEIIDFAREESYAIIDCSVMLFALFVFQEMNLHGRVADDHVAQSRARELLALLDSKGMQSDPLAKAMDSTMVQLRERANATLSQSRVRTTKKYGRNEIVRARDMKSGSEISVKYKKISDRIESGEFEIIEPKR